MKAILFLSLVVSVLSCSNPKEKKDAPPNVILIMADDMGYECLSTYGSTEYETPVLDRLANIGIKFNNAVSQPLCTPTRVKIMTGKYNYRNYGYFGHMSEKEKTFGHLFQEKGYATAISGKWQLNGLSYPNEIEDSNDSSRPLKMGFDEYCLWQLTVKGNVGKRFADPTIEQNGRFLDTEEDDYGPDIFVRFINDFIERNQENPFFIYYPMVLVHDPFVPTPDSEEWVEKEKRFKQDTAYFKDMVAYTDKIVGKIEGKLKELNLDENTIIIFTGDNGTHPRIYTNTDHGVIRGAKGNTIDHGTHVPMIASWPKMIKNGHDFDGLVEFSDFFATFNELVDGNAVSDGHSFLPLLKGEEFKERETAFVHYDPKWGKNVNKFRNQFVRTVDFKLYRDGSFYDLRKDIMEENPIHIDSLNEIELEVYLKLEQELKIHPELK